MTFFRQANHYFVKNSYFKYFLEVNWFIPSDILQRGIEANIWDLCVFKGPVLDIGVGNGEISKIIFKNHPQMATGIDIDDSGLEQVKASKKYKNVLCVNAEKMPFKDQSFNTVVSNSTFEHIIHDTKAVAEVARVLKKSGLFFVTVPSNFLQEWVLEYETKKDPIHAHKRLQAFNSRTNHLHYRSINDWQNIFKKMVWK